MKSCPVCATEYGDDVRFCPNDGQTLRAAAPTVDLVGQVIADRYLVVRKLGEGGMGQVYLAEHVKMGRRSAIKVMTPAMMHDPDAVARFNREAANASRITDPHVCAIYDFGETPEGLIYLAMEFVEGEPLTDLLAREGALSVRRAASIFFQVADALEAAHALGIVHRDLKPDNIMLTRGRDGADVVKVVDFGIAKVFGTDDTQKVTKTGLVVGTPEFMSPEQLSGDRLDGRSDIYALALVLFKMLTNKLPFEAATVQEMMVKRLTDDPLSLAAARPDLAFPGRLQETLDTALSRAPLGRYQSAAAFADDVARLLGVARGGAARALPLTRGGADERTELLGGAPAAPRAATSTRGPRRTLVTVGVGVAVAALLAAGGVGVRLLGGKRSVAVSEPDTARPGAARTPSDTLRAASLGPAARAAAIVPARAGALLDALIDRPPSVILDSAALVYTTPGVAVKDRAFAACLLAQAYASRGNRSAARQWARQGLQLDATLRSCLEVLQHGDGP